MCAAPTAIFLLGPTAVGKSEVALLLAEQLGGEVVSVDSMQVYRGMDIGTAKPSASERARVAHHLVDIIDVAEPFDAAKFVALAQQAVSEIQARGHTPVFCGGTGFYFKAFLEGLGEAPPANPELRAELEAAPLSDLLQELAKKDPITYERIDRQNPRRVIRAMEVIRLTGKPFAQQQARWSTPQKEGNLVGLTRASGDLRNRIDLRVEEMFRRGLVAETEHLLQNGLAQNRTALQALGYRQVEEYLRGVRSLPDTLELVKIRTRQFAKRQMTWFRRQLDVQWFGIEPNEPPETTAARVLKTFSFPQRSSAEK